MRRCAVLLASSIVTACRPAVLDPRGPVGLAEQMILTDSLAIMLAIVVPTIAATFAFAWWFRASNTRARHLPDWTYSGRIELIVWSIPLLVIMLLGGVAWIGSHDLDPAKPLPSNAAPLEVQRGVAGLEVALHLSEPARCEREPARGSRRRTRSLLLTSASVMNAFFIPQLGSMIYTMNGMTTQLNLQANAPGVFRGLSSHYSGDGFSDMHFDVLAVPAEQFAAWIEATRNAGPSLDAASYAALARQSINMRPFTFRAVDPELFQRIVTQELPPGPGPRTGRPQASVSPRTED